MQSSPNHHHLTVAEKENMHRQIIECSFETTIIHSNQKVLYINEAGADFLRSARKDLIGANVVDVFTEDYREFIIERIRKGEEDRIVGELVETSIYRMDGTVVEVELFCHPVMYGETNAMQSIIRDITLRKEAEKELAKVMTPIVPLYNGIAILPLVGSIDDVRSQQLIEVIPSKIQSYHLEHLIIDVSGSYNMDENVVEFLRKFVSILVLLGISPICTGLRPPLAQKMVDLCNEKGIQSLTTMATVKQALNWLSN